MEKVDRGCTERALWACGTLDFILRAGMVAHSGGCTQKRDVWEQTGGGQERK